VTPREFFAIEPGIPVAEVFARPAGTVGAGRKPPPPLVSRAIEFGTPVADRAGFAPEPSGGRPPRTPPGPNGGWPPRTPPTPRAVLAIEFGIPVALGRAVGMPGVLRAPITGRDRPGGCRFGAGCPIGPREPGGVA